MSEADQEVNVIVAPCPCHHQYAGVQTVICGMDGDPVALKLSCEHEIRWEYFTNAEPFDEFGPFPDDDAIVEEAMYDG